MLWNKIKPKFSSLNQRLKKVLTKENLIGLISKLDARRWEVEWSEIFHVSIRAALPFALVALINWDLTIIAFLLVLASKWRMFYVRPNHLIANIRANLTDLTVKLAVLSFMTLSGVIAWQLVFAAGYAVWLLVIKPMTSRFWIAAQALTSQILGLTALMLHSDFLHGLLILIGIWLVVYVTSFHFLSDHEDEMAKTIAKVWALLAVQLAWLFLRWNLAYFSVIPQYVLLQGALSVLAADLYVVKLNSHLDNKRLQFYLLSAAVIIIVMIVSGDWSGRISM